MDFTCAELLGLNHSFQLWGDSANYRNITNLSIKGRVTGAPGANSISGVWSGINTFVGFTGYESIIINGYPLGNGRLVNINFDENTDVVSKKYSASIEILETGNLWNYSGIYYSGFYGVGADLSTGPVFGPENARDLKYINSFSEDITSDLSNSGEIKREKSISVEIDGSYTGNPQSFFSGIYSKIFKQDNNLKIFNALYPSYYTGVPVVYESYSYNDVTRQYNASQNFTYSTGNPWTWNYRHNLSYNKDGTITVAEDGDIKSTLYSGSDKNYYGNLGWTQIQSGMFNRVSGVYYLYTTSGQNKLYSGNCSPLINHPISYNLSRNTLVGAITYNKTYTNNPIQKTGYSFSYEDEISADEVGNITVSENGSFKAYGNDRVSGYNLISTAYANETGNIYSRVMSLYTGNYTKIIGCSGDKTLKLNNTEEAYQQYRQQIDYSYVYSDDESVLENDTIRKIVASYSDAEPVLTVGYFNIFNDAEIAQRQDQSSAGIFTNNINIIGKQDTTISNYLERAYTKVVIPSQADTFLSNASYSLKKPTHDFNLTLEYTYFEHPVAPDTIL